MSKAHPNIVSMRRYVIESIKNHIDPLTGTVNLTQLEEDVFDEFDIDDMEASEFDLSFEIHETVRKSGQVEDTGTDFVYTVPST